MPNYQNGKIYKIVGNGLTYYGSTCKTLPSRLSGHLGRYRIFKKTNQRYMTSFQCLEENDYKIELVENYPCEGKDELLARERFYIENNECVNKNIPNRTRKETLQAYDESNKDKKKKYYKDNIEKISEYKKKYQIDNAAKIKLAKKEYHEKNKEVLDAKKKVYFEANKDTINARRQEKNICDDCGGSYTTQHKSEHIKSKKHQKSLQ